MLQRLFWVFQHFRNTGCHATIKRDLAYLLLLGAHCGIFPPLFKTKQLFENFLLGHTTTLQTLHMRVNISPRVSHRLPFLALPKFFVDLFARLYCHAANPANVHQSLP